MKYNRLLCYIILGIWTLSLLQFTLVLTATRARRDQSGVPSQTDGDKVGCCNPEIYGIMTSIMMQDCPFLVVRLLLIFKYHVISYTNMFFTSKNSLVIILLMYRVLVIQTEARRKRAELKISGSPIGLNVQNNIGRFVGRGGGGQMYLKPSCSAPNVYKTTQGDNSLPRYKNLHDRRSDPIDATRLLPYPTKATPPRSPCNLRPFPLNIN